MTRTARRRRGPPRSKAIPIAKVADIPAVAALLAEKEAEGWPRPKSITAFPGKTIVRWQLVFSRRTAEGRHRCIYTWRTAWPVSPTV
ncbi:hypothetical protein [Xanthobacter autotrophicus]|uniref:hypothetical protein n=1 Tax=Xanthobacter autotrophicus TaxID=280 RepID=UPI003729C39C